LSLGNEINNLDEITPNDVSNLAAIVPNDASNIAAIVPNDNLSQIPIPKSVIMSQMALTAEDHITEENLQHFPAGQYDTNQQQVYTFVIYTHLTFVYNNDLVIG